MKVDELLIDGIESLFRMPESNVEVGQCLRLCIGVTRINAVE